MTACTCPACSACLEHGTAVATAAPRPPAGSLGACWCEHVNHAIGPFALMAWGLPIGGHGHGYGAMLRLVYWLLPLGAAVCGPCGLAIMADFPEEVEAL